MAFSAHLFLSMRESLIARMSLPSPCKKSARKNRGEYRDPIPTTSVDADALCEAALQPRRDGRPGDAQGCCQRALEASPDHADSLHLMGLLLLDAKQYDHAVEWFSRAIRRDPKSLT
jgi:tetratricopeptide (TPR) repeat protein